MFEAMGFVERSQLNTLCNTAFQGQDMFVFITDTEQRMDARGKQYTAYKLSLREV